MNFQLDAKRTALVFSLLLSCLTGLSQREATLLDHQDRIRISPVGILNSPYRETNISITPDGKYLYFMSLRGGQYWSNPGLFYDNKQQFDGDIWYSQRVNGRWQPPKCLPMGLNTTDGEDEPSISPDGKTVYFQSWSPFWTVNGGPYYKSTLSNGVWGQPQGLGGKVTEFFTQFNATDGMAISPDGKRMVVACGTDYNGIMDIYMSTKTSSGWGTFRKLPISTGGNERSVFIARDGRTLYFASNGYKGYGGLDIYKATINDDGTLGEVINVGPPFNTPNDDYGFILAANDQEAYFVRNGDIYYADLREADARIRPELEIGLNGMVRDSKTQLGLRADIIVTDLSTNRLVKKVRTGTRGKYTISLPNRTAKYEVKVVCDGYPQDNKQLIVSRSENEQAFAVDFMLEKLAEAPATAARTAPPRPSITPASPNAVMVPLSEAEPITPPLPPPPPPLPPVTALSEKEFPPLKMPVPRTPEQVSFTSDLFSFDGVATNNLVFLVDASASMNRPDRLPLVKKTMKTVLTHMRPEDQISIILYSGEVTVLLEGISAIEHEGILKMLNRVSPGDQSKTQLGIKRAQELAQKLYIENGNNRIILLTDGDYNIPEVYKTATRYANKGVPMSVFSVGKQIPSKEKEMALLAHKSQGNYINLTHENAVEAFINEAKAVRK